jgi:DNA-binding LacI/PurR family transcriptional regulator
MPDYLVERGYRDFAYVGYSGSNYWDIEREEGFRAGLARNQMTPRAAAGKPGLVLPTEICPGSSA